MYPHVLLLLTIKGSLGMLRKNPKMSIGGEIGTFFEMQNKINFLKEDSSVAIRIRDTPNLNFRWTPNGLPSFLFARKATLKFIQERMYCVVNKRHLLFRRLACFQKSRCK